MHFTVPLTCATGDNYSFPSEYIGQYGVFEAVKHIYSKNSNLAHLINNDGNSLMTSNKYFASEMEKGIDHIRQEWRQKHEINDD